MLHAPPTQTYRAPRPEGRRWVNQIFLLFLRSCTYIPHVQVHYIFKMKRWIAYAMLVIQALRPGSRFHRHSHKEKNTIHF